MYNMLFALFSSQNSSVLVESYKKISGINVPNIIFVCTALFIIWFFLRFILKRVKAVLICIILLVAYLVISILLSKEGYIADIKVNFVETILSIIK